jgi:two-component system phosphate regulon sensor histidine kinase PhoR
MGIPEEDIPALFDRFYRASNVAHEEITGWGIGIYVVKELVVGYGGKIEVQSALEKGSTFTLKFPLHRANIAVETKPIEPSLVLPREDRASAAPSE